jgi:hypothetical protein
MTQIKTWAEADREDRNVTIERCAQIAYDSPDTITACRRIRALKDTPTQVHNDLCKRIAELEREHQYLVDKLYPLLDALRDLPELPPPRVLLTLSHAADFSKDWNTGKRIQREKGLGAVPPKTECEEGAGWWHRIIKRGQTGD